MLMTTRAGAHDTERSTIAVERHSRSHAVIEETMTPLAYRCLSQDRVGTTAAHLLGMPTLVPRRLQYPMKLTAWPREITADVGEGDVCRESGVKPSSSPYWMLQAARVI